MVAGIAGATLGTLRYMSPVKLWSVPDLQELATLTTHTQNWRSVAFSPDGALLAAAQEHLRLRLWDVQTRSLRSLLLGNAGRFWSIRFSPGGCTLASASVGHSVKLWDLRRPAVRRLCPLHPKPVSSIAFLQDGCTLATVCHDSKIRQWNSDTGEPVGEWELPVGDLYGLSVSPTEQLLAAGTSFRKTIRALVHRFHRTHSGGIQSRHFHPAGLWRIAGPPQRTPSSGLRPPSPPRGRRSKLGGLLEGDTERERDKANGRPAPPF